MTNNSRTSLRRADVFHFLGGREATTENTSAVRRLQQDKQYFFVVGRWGYCMSHRRYQGRGHAKKTVEKPTLSLCIVHILLFQLPTLPKLPLPSKSMIHGELCRRYSVKEYKLFRCVFGQENILSLSI